MIEKLVTNLETSQKLKELGVLQESCFYWVGTGEVLMSGKKRYYLHNGYPNQKIHIGREIISAWTLEELLEMTNYTGPYGSRAAKVSWIFKNSGNDKEYIKKINTNLKKWREAK